MKRFVLCVCEEWVVKVWERNGYVMAGDDVWAKVNQNEQFITNQGNNSGNNIPGQMELSSTK
jgi:hypothetical protein